MLQDRRFRVQARRARNRIYSDPGLTEQEKGQKLLRFLDALDEVYRP